MMRKIFINIGKKLYWLDFPLMLIVKGIFVAIENDPFRMEFVWNLKDLISKADASLDGSANEALLSRHFITSCVASRRG